MTTPTRLERSLPEILGDLSAGPTPDYLDDVFGRTGRMRQRPAWTFPERWLPMADITNSRAFAPAPPWRLIAVALVVIAMLVAALLYVGAQERRVPAPFGPARNGLITYDKGDDIYVGDPVAGTSRLVVGGPERDTSPGYSPDGTLIAFFRSPDGIDLDVYTVRPDGTDVRRVTAAPIQSISWALWTPDSRHLAVIREVDGHNRLDVVDMDGKAVRLAGDYDVSSFAFRPPLGQEILFRGVKDGVISLYAMNADGSNVHALITSPRPTDADFEYANNAYSADGSRIFYQSWTQGGVRPDGCCQLWVMDADGSNPHQFPGSRLINSWEGVPAVSPDGKWVAFWRVKNELPTQRVSVVRADGTGFVTQTGPELNGFASWAWSPDSSTILMAPQDDVDPARQYILDPSGGPWTETAWETRTSPEWQRMAP